jgi:hypothetical protein
LYGKTASLASEFVAAQLSNLSLGHSFFFRDGRGWAGSPAPRFPRDSSLRITLGTDPQRAQYNSDAEKKRPQARAMYAAPHA